MGQILSKGVGIDLGTTNSAVAVLDRTDSDIVLHRDERANTLTTPSCVWKDPATGEIVVGRKALRRVGTRPEPIRSIKRLMGHPKKVVLTDSEATPEAISAAILTEMRRQIELDVARWNTASTSWVVDRAIVTVPAYFDNPNIEATRKAAEMAGLDLIDLLDEPTAAASYHCWRTRTEDGTFLVFDLGGGTFDVSVVRCTAGVFEVLGIAGNNQLGGDDIDAEVAYRLRDLLVSDGYALDLDIENDPDDRIRFSQLKFLAEAVKIGLSNSPEFMLRDMGTLKDKNGDPVIIESMWERSAFESVAEPFVRRTISYCHEAIGLATRNAAIALENVDRIILAGGSTHVPLVRELVTAELCARTKHPEPVYESVDTIVALGAAVRAAAVGGLATYNEERTVRVSFRGTGSTGTTMTTVAGRAESLGNGPDLTGGHIGLSTQDYEDEADLRQGGAFAFTDVPIQPEAESLLTFEVFDGDGRLVATAGRPVVHNPDQRPDGGPSTPRLAKAFVLEVNRGGSPYLRELIPALAILPTSADFTFSHPGDTEMVRFPLYQRMRQIHVITVPVPSSTPRGTPIKFNVRIDELSMITVVGTIGDVPFDAVVTLPPPREMPTEEEIQQLATEFEQALEYVPAGERAVFTAKWGMVSESLRAAVARGDELRAIHEVEELGTVLGSVRSDHGVLQPPKDHFDRTVSDCRDLNELVRRLAAEAGVPHDDKELAKAIEVQREQGERAFRDQDQKSYTETINMLDHVYQHLAGIYRKLRADDGRSEAERLDDRIKYVGKVAADVLNRAEEQRRGEFAEEARALQRELGNLAAEAYQEPRRVQLRADQIIGRLRQLWNIMEAARQGDGSKLVVDS